MTDEVGDKRRTLRNFISPGVQIMTSRIAHANVEAHNFELKPALISLLHGTTSTI